LGCNFLLHSAPFLLHSAPIEDAELVLENWVLRRFSISALETTSNLESLSEFRRSASKPTTKEWISVKLVKQFVEEFFEDIAS